MTSVGFEIATTASERSQTHSLDSAATGIGKGENRVRISDKTVTLASGKDKEL
jgi:hypothetical protein